MSGNILKGNQSSSGDNTTKTEHQKKANKTKTFLIHRTLISRLNHSLSFFSQHLNSTEIKNHGLHQSIKRNTSRLMPSNLYFWLKKKAGRCRCQTIVRRICIRHFPFISERIVVSRMSLEIGNQAIPRANSKTVDQITWNETKTHFNFNEWFRQINNWKVNKTKKRRLKQDENAIVLWSACISQ